MYFQIVGPWTRPQRTQPNQGQRAAAKLFIGIVLAVISAAGLLAWRNLRLGKGDRQGAFRLGLFVMSCSLLSWLCTAHHVPVLEEFQGLFRAAAWSLLFACILWLLYMALEPYVRRQWPQSMISWSRLLAGGARDPLVGGHVLIGLSMGVGYTLFIFLGEDVVSQRYGSAGRTVSLESLLDVRRMIGNGISDLATSISNALVLLFVFLLLRALFRRPWLAASIFVLLFSVQTALVEGHPVISAPFAALQFGLAIAILIRFGVLPMAVGIFVSSILPSCPMTTDFSAWYASVTIFAFLTVLAMAAYSFRISLAGRPLLKAGFLEN